MLYVCLECSTCPRRVYLRYMTRGSALANARDMGWRVEGEGSPAWCPTCVERGADGAAQNTAASTRHNENEE